MTERLPEDRFTEQELSELGFNQGLIDVELPVHSDVTQQEWDVLQSFKRTLAKSFAGRLPGSGRPGPKRKTKTKICDAILYFRLFAVDKSGGNVLQAAFDLAESHPRFRGKSGKQIHKKYCATRRDPDRIQRLIWEAASIVSK